MAGNLVGGGGGLSESINGLFCGFVYGVTSPLIGHPLDTVKTLMQASTASARGSAFAVARDVVAKGGIRALYRGLLPPLVGSSIFRSVQFSAYGFAIGSQRESGWGDTIIPHTGGLQTRVLAAGLFSSFARSLIETPLEYIKVRQQVAKSVLGSGGFLMDAAAAPLTALRQCYTGFGISFLRTFGLMGTFFVLVDSLERHQPELLAIPFWGAFLKGAVCSSIGWFIVWPGEVLKSQVQAGTSGVPDKAGAWVRLKWVLKERGITGLYRGIGPGLSRSLIANGASMVALSKCRELLLAAPA